MNLLFSIDDQRFTFLSILCSQASPWELGRTILILLQEVSWRDHLVDSTTKSVRWYPSPSKYDMLWNYLKPSTLNVAHERQLPGILKTWVKIFHYQFDVFVGLHEIFTRKFTRINLSSDFHFLFLQLFHPLPLIMISDNLTYPIYVMTYCKVASQYQHRW